MKGQDFDLVTIPLRADKFFLPLKRKTPMYASANIHAGWEGLAAPG